MDFSSPSRLHAPFRANAPSVPYPQSTVAAAQPAHAHPLRERSDNVKPRRGKGRRRDGDDDGEGADEEGEVSQPRKRVSFPPRGLGIGLAFPLPPRTPMSPTTTFSLSHNVSDRAFLPSPLSLDFGARPSASSWPAPTQPQTRSAALAAAATTTPAPAAPRTVLDDAATLSLSPLCISENVEENRQPRGETKESKRAKQIGYGKATLGYVRYRHLVPPPTREPGHPRTPRVDQRCSKRSWDGQVRKWRRGLHAWDPQSEAEWADAAELWPELTRRELDRAAGGEVAADDGADDGADLFDELASEVASFQASSCAWD